MVILDIAFSEHSSTDIAFLLLDAPRAIADLMAAGCIGIVEPGITMLAMLRIGQLVNV